ncbi:GGDEF domain-containing protein [Ideonella oryzae]|uniref:diguanylate cyclase n=1 Tax=Ideonella oryzae TaxID=2937441 RepID=A0ABT1BHI9_9BURK|nr:GGDEF domain-containing protein [Ideonella oryzae]
MSLSDPSCLVPDEASEFIRQNFRTTIRGSAVVIACVACVYAVALWRVGDPHWWHHGLIALLAVALQPWFGRQASYPGFIGALLLLISTCTVSIGALALTYGPAALFHALLLAYTPVLVTSGRLPPWAKVLLVAGACLLTLWLDAASAARWAQRAATEPQQLPTPEILQRLRDINLLALGLAPAVLVYHFFTLVSRQHSTMVRLALHDPMTQLFNRRHVQATGEALVARLLDRPQGGPFSVVLLDVDHFKRVNDTWGHEIGDQALRHVADLISRTARASDVVARWGGEEFLLLLADTDEAQAVQLAERLRSAIADDALGAHGEPVRLTVTIGVAQSLRAGSFADVIRRADAALYEGKRQGRNRVVAASVTGTEAVPADLAGI